jgi:uncharacterized caspase-like protein
MTRRWTRRSFAAFAAAAGVAHAQAPKRKFALVIANSDYDGDGRVDASQAAVLRARERGFVGDLVNPWFDQVRVGEALRGAGFEVETVLNADRAVLYGATARWRARADAPGPETASVLYYAGHGVQIGGRNYLVGCRAQLTGEMPAATAEERDRIALAVGMPVQFLLMGGRHPTAPGYRLILIDACRDNPWEEMVRAQAAALGRDYAGERAFGALSAPPRTVIGFSAQPGQFAQDGLAAASSPFANAVSRRARQRGAPIDDMLRSVMGEVAAASGAQQIPNVYGRFGDGTSLN